MSRKEVYFQAKEEFKDIGEVFEFAYCRDYPDTCGDEFNFGIRYFDNPSVLCIVTYGPEVHFPHGWQGPAVSKGNGKYTCYAS